MILCKILLECRFHLDLLQISLQISSADFNVDYIMDFIVDFICGFYRFQKQQNFTGFHTIS